MANYTYGVSLLIANVAIAISAVGYGTELFGAALTPLQIGLATIAAVAGLYYRKLWRRAYYRTDQ
ncbi:hypothetical protein KCP73_03900 [Salmonella enterica subsp. enterica]|nr:hypothetical protein KCP73_03900 [Salmonella enterica subsp. enterica]